LPLTLREQPDPRCRRQGHHGLGRQWEPMELRCKVAVARGKGADFERQAGGEQGVHAGGMPAVVAQHQGLEVDEGGAEVGGVLPPGEGRGR
jgi:hypothetical protein